MISPLNCKGWWKVSEGTMAADDMVMTATGLNELRVSGLGAAGRDFINWRAPWKKALTGQMKEI